MKERLTGAIILVALMVLLVPELLTGPTHSSTAPLAASNSSEEPPLRSYTINLADDSHTRATATESGAPAMPQPSGPEQPTTLQQNGLAQPGEAAQPVEPGAPSSGEAPHSAKPGNLAAPPMPTPSATATAPPSARINQPAPATAQPFKPTPKPSRATAQSPKVVTPPAKRAAASPWGVQLGVFASRENAEHLALEVRVKGFKASVTEVTGSGRKLYRVRVGPAPDRSAAQDLQGRLKAAGRPGGTVVPYS